jgi:hypothetical protein
MATVTSWGAAIITSFTVALNLVFAFIPKLVGFLVILLIGWIVGTAVSKAVVFLLKKVGFDRFANRVGLARFEQRMGLTLDPAVILGKVVYWFVFLIFLVPAVNALGLTAVSNILNQIIAYIPNVFAAILVLFLGTLAALFLSDIVRGAFSGTNIANPGVLAAITRWAIIGFAAIIALEQLQIATAIMNELFGAVVAGAALAFGLAFGLGGRETAQRLLNRGESKLNSATSQMNAQQSMNAMQQQGMNAMNSAQQPYQQPASPYAQPGYSNQPGYPTPPVPGQGQAYPGQQVYPGQQEPYGTPTEPYNRPSPR